jgi:hypothetical protein
MNKKAIVTRTKKKLRVGQAVFNKKEGIYEWQIREGGRIVHREPVEGSAQRIAESIREKSPEWKARTVTYDKDGNQIQPKPFID